METHFDKDLSGLTRELLRLGSMGEEAIERALAALTTRDPEIARLVIEGDAVMDQQELLIDQLCIDLLALHQPVAMDLRIITAALKINPEIERMGDLAVNIGERALELGIEPPLKPLIDIPRMAKIASEMLHGSLDAFMDHGAAAALELLITDA